ncbi:RNA polymerase II transcription factor B 52 kDa subunit [Thoreauomyces humboldtii]|nr:RNA polymerase II transcription factor B 52 kDa subunit [Thoreauomyces humboldtii]
MSTDTSKAVTKSIQEYLEGLDSSKLDLLYAQPATCLAILRLLPPVAKQIVMRLLYTQRPVSRADIETWCYQAHSGTLHESLKKLSKLHICVERRDRPDYVQMNRTFQENFHNALVGGGNHVSFGEPMTDTKHDVDIPLLDRHAAEAWETVLHYLVGTPSERRPKAVARLLVASGLQEETRADRQRMDDGGDGYSDQKGEITSKGFQFLLLDVNVQVWSLLLQYLELAENRLNMDIVQVLNFLFQIGTLELGQAYSIEPLTETQRKVMEDLKHFGLFYQRTKKSRRFYPTRMATSLTSGSMLTTRQPEDSQGYIIIETNFRMYAYTDSPLQIAILSLFVSLQARFQNMVTGLITRDCIREALGKGITADQIIEYLTAHAHPELKKQSPILPQTVVDQIKLWDMERNRLRMSAGSNLREWVDVIGRRWFDTVFDFSAWMYSDFADMEEFREIVRYAEPYGAVLWKNEKKKILAVSEEGHEKVKAYRKKVAASKAANSNGASSVRQS